MEQFLVILGLLNKQWSNQQLLVAFSVPNKHQSAIHSKPYMQCLLPKCSVAIKRWNCCLAFHSCTHIQSQQETPGNTKLTLIHPLKRYGLMVHESNAIVNKGILRHMQNVCMEVILGLSQLTYNKTIRVSCRSMSCILT